MSLRPNIPEYVTHPGTIRVSGMTNPRDAAACAMHMLMDDTINSVDFSCIGANANQQAAKAMCILLHQFSAKFDGTDVGLAFQPLLFSTKTALFNDKSADHVKGCTIWRVVMFTASITSIPKDKNDNGKENAVQSECPVGPD